MDFEPVKGRADVASNFVDFVVVHRHRGELLKLLVRFIVWRDLASIAVASFSHMLIAVIFEQVVLVKMC